MSAVERWRELQAQIADSGAWVEKVAAGLPEAGLMYGGQPAMVVAEPSFVTESDVAADQRTASSVLSALIAAGQHVMADPALQSRFLGGWLDGVPDADLFTMDPGYPNPVVFGRLDGVRTPDGLRVLEFNGGLPGGILPADASARFLQATSLGQDFAQEQPYAIATAGEDVVQALVTTWHEFGGSDLPFTVIALPEELTAIASPGVNYLVGIARGIGMEIEVTDPGKLTYSDGRLRLEGRPVDVLVRAFFTPMFAYLGERLDAIKAALRDGSICMIASLQSGLFGLKSLFALVTDPAAGIDTPGIEVARAALPWTRLVEAVSTEDPHGNVGPLVDYLAADRENLVIKPSEGYGGAGVELGWKHTPETWAEVIERALAGGHVAQQRIPILPEEFSVLEEGFPVRSFTTDHNPLLCGGKVAGYYVRLAREGDGLTNVTGGGATVAPTFVLPG